MKNIILVLFSFFSISSLCTNVWKPMGLMNNDERRELLIKEFQNNFAQNSNSERVIELFKNKMISENEMNKFLLTPGIHTVLLPDFGRSFSFDGNIDIVFCNYLQDKINEDLTLLMPAFGVGRSIMDIISINPNAKIIANDLQDTREYVNKLLNDYNYSNEKISYLIGDILNVIENIENDSVDAIYVPNLIHFLSPFKVRNLLCEFNRILKPRGKIFICWKNMLSQEFKNLSDNLVKNEIPYPRYIDEKYSYSISDDIILPYNDLSIEDMQKHAEKALFSINEFGIEYPVAIAINNGLIKFGEYKFEKQQNFINQHQNKFMILEKQLVNDLLTQKITSNEVQYFEKRKNIIKKLKRNK